MYEIRWFFEGTIPDEVKQWLASVGEQGALSFDEKPRKEVYFLCAQDISPKISRGGLELKYRVREGEVFSLKTGETGLLEDWEKKEWKYPTGEKPDAVKDTDPVFFAFATLTDGRFVTEKVRAQKKFKYENGKFISVDVIRRESGERGFAVELVNLEVKGSGRIRGSRNRWSLLFEWVAGRESADDRKLLREGMEWALGSQWTSHWPSDQLLDVGNSMSFPGLFARLSENEPMPGAANARTPI